MATGEVTPELLSASLRLIDLLGTQEDIPIPAPVIQREIIYRLLVGDQGGGGYGRLPRREAGVSRSPGRSSG